MLITILSSRGTCMMLPSPSDSLSCSRISVSYFTRRRGRVVVSVSVMSELLPALAADPGLVAAVGQLVADAGRTVARAEQRDVADVERHVLVDDAALHGGAGRLLVLLGDVDALDDDLALARHGAHDHALLAAVLALQHDHAVTLTNLHHSTSGASETMRMNFLSRSSRPTGPKMRVPRGCIWSLMRTAAFSSKRM